MTIKRICVIGAGVSGLVALKTCLEEGFIPTCLEKRDVIGGVWNYRAKYDANATEGQLYNCLVTNSSKMMMNFSDFPFPRSAPPYLPGQTVNSYYEAYARHFDLNRYIRFNTEVLEIKPATDYDITGRWSVRIKIQDNEEVTEIYDAVMLSTGLFAKSTLPHFPGQELFEGEILHSNEFRKGEVFENKTVLVVGASHSAGDVAVDCSYHTKQVYLSTRCGAWVLTRVCRHGVPRDLVNHRRVNTYLPPSIRQWFLKKEISSRMSLANTGLLPTKDLSQSRVMINDSINAQIICGKIKTLPNLERFTEKGVTFVDGTTLDGIDTVIFATGYQLDVPFVDDNLIPDTFKDLELYMYVFPPHLKHPTFAAIGFFETVGSHAPIMELQSRWACRVFKGLCHLPPQDVMVSNVQMKKQMLLKKFGVHRIFSPALPFQEVLSDLIGSKPNILKMALTDPTLAFKCFFGPAYPFYYRLQGPHTWPGARDAIINAWDDTLLSTRTILSGQRSKYKIQFYNSPFIAFKFIMIISMFLCLIFYVIN